MPDLNPAARSSVPPPRGDTIAALIAALRQFWGLAGLYWREHRRAAWAVTAGLVLATLANALLQLRLNLWLGDFFDAIGAHAANTLWRGVFVFVLLALGLTVTGAALISLKAALQIGWRAWITDRLVDHWLEHGHDFMIRAKGEAYDNPDHRIAEDVRMVTEAAVDFAAGLINSALLLIIFIGALWALSGVVTIGGFAVPGYLVIAAVGYAAVTTTLTHFLGRPLVRLSETRHAREGDFRFHLVRVRENTEGMALLRGEPIEREGLRNVFDRLVRAFRAQMGLTTRLTLATTGFTVLNPVLPLLIAAPQYLAGRITLGELMQISQAFVQVQLALGFFIDNYSRLSDWMAGINRIVELDAACTEHEVPGGSAEGRIERRTSADGILRLVDLGVASPGGPVMMDTVTAAIAPGERVLVTGDVGIGKTTLFRAVAGLWPWGRGAIEMPAGVQTIFVPHRPYVPSGSLRMAITYPRHVDEFDDAAVRAALARCGLEDYADKLDIEARWDQTLSESEQQRLAFVRLVLHRPEWVVMAEATSELDDAAEADLMSIFAGELKGVTLLTIAQRSSLGRFHDRTLILARAKGGAHPVRARAEPANHVAPGAPSWWPLSALWRFFFRPGS